MNARTFNDKPPENTVLPWLLPCTCGLQRCHCNARFKPDILCIKGLSYQANLPIAPINSLKIQFIKFTYCNDRFSPETITSKTKKYQPLIDNIAYREWNVKPLIVITTSARATTHISSIKILEKKFKISETTIKQTFSNINTIAILHAMSIILYKRRLENNEPLLVEQNSP